MYLFSSSELNYFGLNLTVKLYDDDDVLFYLGCLKSQVIHWLFTITGIDFKLE